MRGSLCRPGLSPRQGLSPVRRERATGVPVIVGLLFALALSATLALSAAGQTDPGQAGEGVAAEPAPVPSAPASTPYLAELELTAQTRQSLRRIAEIWDQWILAYYQEDSDRSGDLVEQLLETAQEVGLTRLPDLAIAAQVGALEAARNGDYERARWALEVASRLDPDRPENEFVSARVAWHRSNFPVSLFHSTRGLLQLVRLPSQRRLVILDVALWGLGVLLLTGTFFVALQMASKGGGLFRDLVRLLSRFMPPWLSYPLSVVLLLWPLLLPYGPLWMILGWSILLWGYGSPSERTVLIGLWLLLGTAPFLVVATRDQVWQELSPSVQVLDQVRSGRLYGDLFRDLEVLRTSLPESTAVQHFLADLYGILGQWDLARSLYDQVLQKEPNQPGILINLGAYYFFTNDFGSAVEHFQRAASMNPRDAVALFNLGQTYSEQYFFDESQAAIAQARTLDNEAVTQWLKRTGRDRIITPLTGFSRAGEIRRELAAKWAAENQATSRDDLLRRGTSLLGSLALIIIALLLHLVRRPFGYAEPPIDLSLDRGIFERLIRAFLPGLEAAEVGEGGHAFVSLLVAVSLLMLPLGGVLTFSLPLGFAPGKTLPWTIAILGLLIFFGVRLVRELRRGR